MIALINDNNSSQNFLEKYDGFIWNNSILKILMILMAFGTFLQLIFNKPVIFILIQEYEIFKCK